MPLNGMRCTPSMAQCKDGSGRDLKEDSGVVLGHGRGLVVADLLGSK